MLRIDIKKEQAKKLRKWLHESNYGFIYKSMAGIFNTVEPWVEESIIEEMIKDVSEKDKHIVEFFLLGYDKDKDLLMEILGEEILEIILHTGFALEEDNIVKSQGFVILPIDNLFLIVSLPSCYKNSKKRMSDIYIGSDSTKLMKYIKKEHYRNVLDLCAGSGVQGINVADYADKVVEVEINEVAYSAAVLNGKINGLPEEKYEVRNGDLYETIVEKYDCIISNPPFVPVPKDIIFPICGDGGEDGLDLVRKIVGGYEKYLNDSGKAYMVLECIGDDNGPYVVDSMRDVLDRGIINISLINRQQIEFQADASAKIAIEIYKDPQNYDIYYKAWMEMFERTNAVYIYPVVVEYIKTNQPLKINYIRNYNKWSLDSRFKLINNIEIDKCNQEYYSACIDGKSRAVFDKEVKELLECAEEKSLRDNLGISEDARKHISRIKKLLTTSNNLEMRGIISRK